MFNVILHDEVPDEIADLPPVIRAKMIRLIDKLKMNATALREPDSKPVRDGLFELRTMGTDIARGLYVYQKGKNIYLLRVFIKKTQKLPSGEITLAFERLEEMLHDKS
ncbi:type II toxin-antitoxin system RelE/ParE family toxin [Yersinia pseudotuberculosis]|uniref:type II toxin-antitoxin system RelE/ParE family toxin n=1 Tax=Yersinia pseudotuberculosis TaxID=633 RepID=UPI001A9F51CC|nr:type II toxin-antitoxin system RelE/ParE family toxin [Yersinia pseudotuberculosis]MBO1631940.1 type II toxin-antitoxin system RelE/ParE family toxin [Yersinia pseudotuberculosis]MBP0069877.1 type II toxin-antitoxin system RelE/ParE family toxin [Yersinia pseudotuberculosis]